MKRYLKALAMCHSMFCTLPAWHVWESSAQKYMLLFLPFVGIEIGGIWAALAWGCNLIQLPKAMSALILAFYPYLITGFIHLDGYMDVTDAIKSWRDLNRRREILKDSHVGSFAVIGVAILLIAQYAFFAAAPIQINFSILIFIPIVSRCCSALAVSALKALPTSEYAVAKPIKSHTIILFIMLSVFLVVGFFFCGKSAWALVGCLAGYVFSLRRAYTSLNGMNGDIAGYALSIGELCAIAVYALI